MGRVLTSSFIKHIKESDYNTKIIDIMTSVTKYIIHNTKTICCNYHINVDSHFKTQQMVGGLKNKINLNDTFNKYIHIYKRYEYL